MKNNLGFFALLISAMMFASDGIIVKELGNYFGYYTISFLLFGIALVVVLALIGFKKIPLRVSREKILSLNVFSVSYLIAFLLFSVAIILSSKVSNTIFMMLCGALLATVLYGTIFLKEGLGIKKIVAIICVTIGIACIAYPFNVEVSLIISFVAGLLYGLANSYRKVLGSIQYEVLIFYQFLMATIIALLGALAVKEHIAKPVGFSPLAVSVYYGFSTVISGLLVSYGFNNFKVNLGQVVLTTELFFALLLNFFFLKEVPTTLESIGAVCIFVGTVVSKYAD